MSISIAHPERYDYLRWGGHCPGDGCPMAIALDKERSEWELLGWVDRENMSKSPIYEGGSYLWGHLKPELCGMKGPD